MAVSASADARPWWWSRWIGWLWVLVLITSGAQAHPMPESRVWIDAQPAGLRLTLQLPLTRLEFAFGQPLAEDVPSKVLSQHREALVRYLLAHVHARSAQQDWLVEVSELGVNGEAGQAELEAVLWLQAPERVDSRRVTLFYDVITHEVRTHRVQVFLRQDWAGGQGAQPPRPLVQLDTAHTEWGLDLGPVPSSAVASVRTLLIQGAWHIAEGADHLLFLALLVLVAPLRAVRKDVGWRWEGCLPAVHRWRRMAWVVSAFTLGHSLTLALGSVGVLNWPAAWVEVGVALTLIVAAVHAWQPVWHQGEAGMAATLGLVHGMAFSASLSGAGLSVGQWIQALMAFNLGIELMQLALLALVVPVLWWGCHRWPPGYDRVRQMVSLGGGVMACFWLWERARML